MKRNSFAQNKHERKVFRGGDRQALSYLPLWMDGWMEIHSVIIKYLEIKISSEGSDFAN